MEQSIPNLTNLALQIARRAAQMIAEAAHGAVEVAATKSSAVDLVTHTDRAVESFIRAEIARHRPEDAVVGEEEGSTAGSSGVTWVIDPIDGTVNFVYGIPAYAVSIGVHRNGEGVVGVVINPATGDEYVGSAEGPATRNGEPIRVRDQVPSQEWLVGTGFGYTAQRRELQAVGVAKLLPQVRDIRRMGSCALDLCAVAGGNLDVYYEEGPHIWDHAAGEVIVRAAGGTFCSTTSAAGNTVLVCAPKDSFAQWCTMLVSAGVLAEVPPITQP